MISFKDYISESEKTQAEAFGSVPGMVPTENLTTSKRKGAKGMLKHAYDTQAMEKRLRLAARKRTEKAMNVISPGSVERMKNPTPKKPSFTSRMKAKIKKARLDSAGTYAMATQREKGK